MRRTFASLIAAALLAQIPGWQPWWMPSALGFAATFFAIGSARKSA